jgi:hypothetical protein
MKYKELCTITGMPGLYRLLSTKSDGAIVRNLDDNTTKFIAARTHNVTPLESIEVYTKAENVRLWEVFMSFKKNESHLENFDVQKADQKTIRDVFSKLFPEYDAERVYVNDMKKMIKWFHILKQHDLLQNEEEAEETSIENKNTSAES